MKEIIIRVYVNPKNQSLDENSMWDLSKMLQKAASHWSGVAVEKIRVQWITLTFAFNSTDLTIEAVVPTFAGEIWDNYLSGEMRNALIEALVEFDLLDGWMVTVGVYPVTNASTFSRPA